MLKKLTLLGFTVVLGGCSAILEWVYPEEPEPAWDLLPYTFNYVNVIDKTDNFANKPNIDLDETFGPGEVRLTNQVKRAFKKSLYSQPDGQMRVTVEEFAAVKEKLIYTMSMKATFEAYHKEMGELYKGTQSCNLRSNETFSLGYSEDPDTGERTPIELPGLRSRVVWERLFRLCVNQMLLEVNQGIAQNLRGNQ